MTVLSERQKAQQAETELDVISMDINTDALEPKTTKPPKPFAPLSFLKKYKWWAGIAATCIAALLIGVCTQLWGSTVAAIKQPGIDNVQNLDIRYLREDVNEIQETQKVHTEKLDEILRELK